MGRTKVSLLIVMMSVVWGTLVCPAPAGASVRARVVVVNPSEDLKRTLPVKYYLPTGIRREDVVDTAGMGVEYDISKGLYFVTGEVELRPKEAKTLEIVLRDIWSIPEEEFDKAYQLLDRQTEALEESRKYTQEVRQVAENLRASLDRLVEKQESARDDIERRMQMLSMNLQELKRIKDSVFTLEAIAERGVREEPLMDQQLVTLLVSAQNRNDEASFLTVRYYLPEGIRAEHMVDDGGFEIRHDPVQERLYITKEDRFEANEIKNYRLRIRNVWNIPEEKLDSYISEAEQLFSELKDSTFADTARVLKEAIERNVGNIRISQVSTENVEDLLAINRINRSLQKTIEEDLEKMRLLQIEEETEPTHQVDVILRELEELELIRRVSERIAEYIKKAVWEIIYALVVFMIVLTASFYVKWYKNVKRDEAREYEDLEIVEEDEGTEEDDEEEGEI